MKHKKLKLMGFMIIVLLVTAIPAFAESGKVSIGGFGGWFWSTAGEAVEGTSTTYPDTEFKNSNVYGGSIMYRFPSGFALELCVVEMAMDLEELGEDLGTLNMTPVMLLFKFQGMPTNGIGFTGHADIGGGINFTSFDKGSSIKELEDDFSSFYGVPVSVNVDTDDSFVFELGAGVDYFFIKNFSLSLDGRFLLGNVGTSWDVSVLGASEEMDVDDFHISNFQGLLSARIWF